MAPQGASFQPQELALWDADDDAPEPLRPAPARATARRFAREWADLRAVVQKELAGKLLQPPLSRFLPEGKAAKGGAAAAGGAAGKQGRASAGGGAAAAGASGSKKRFAAVEKCAGRGAANRPCPALFPAGQRVLSCALLTRLKIGVPFAVGAGSWRHIPQKTTAKAPMQQQRPRARHARAVLVLPAAHGEPRSRRLPPPPVRRLVAGSPRPPRRSGRALGRTARRTRRRWRRRWRPARSRQGPEGWRAHNSSLITMLGASLLSSRSPI